MPRIFLPVGAIACWTLLTAACNDKATIIDEGAAGTQAGSGGRSGATGVGGSRAGSAGDGAGGSAGDGSGGSAGDGSGGSAGDGSGGSDEPPDAGPDSGDASAPSVSCSVDSDCADDGNPCTVHDCNPSGVCVTGNAAATVACGSAVDDACTNPDTCNGAGVCIPNHAAEGLVCDANTDEEDDGHCTVGVCDCASERLTGATVNTQWQTSATDPDLVSLACDEDGCANIPDHVVVFTAPSAGTFRFFAAASEGGNTALAVLTGDCAPAPGAPLGCNDDIVGADAAIADSELDVELTAAQVVTVVVTTPCENTGGDGVLRIELLPAP